MAGVPIYQNDAAIYSPAGASGDTPFATPGGAMTPAVAPVGKSVNVVDKDGKVFGLDEAYLGQAQAQGYKVETPEAKAIREYVAENAGLGGTAKVALHGFLDQATFGVFGAVDEHGQNALDKAKAEALKQDHAVANILGQAAGFGASMFYGGEILQGASKAGRVAEAAVMGERLLGTRIAAKMVQNGVPAAEAATHGVGLARKLLASGAKYAAEGAVFAAPKAVTEAALGDADRAAETLMYGLGGGAVFGLAGGAAGAVGKAMSSGAGALHGMKVPGLGDAAAKVREWGDEQAVSALDLGKKYADRLRDRGMTSDAAKLFRESGVGELAGDAEAIAARMGELKSQTGEKIGAIYKAADGAGANAKTTLEELAAAMRPVVDAKGEALIGKVAAKESVEAWVGKEIIGPVAQEIGPAGALSLEQLHKIRQAVDRVTKWDAALDTAVNETRMDLRGQLTKLIDAKLDAAGSTLGKELRAELAPLNREYGLLSVLSDNAENNVGRALANRRHSLSDYAGNAIGGVVGGAIGGGAGSVIGAGVGGVINNQLRRKAPAALSGAAHTVADWMERRAMSGVLEANAQAAEQLARVPALLTGLAESKTEKAGAIGVDAVVSYARAMSGGKPKDDGGAYDSAGPEHVRAFTRLASAITEMTSNPERMGEAVRKLTDPFAAGAPGIAAQLALKAPAVVNHLQATMPKAPPPQGLFAPKRQWAPTETQVAEWGRRWAVVDNPFTVMDRLGDRTLTRAEVETLRAVYPKLHQEMVGRVLAHAQDPKAKPLAFGDRDRLSLLLGVSVDGTDYGAFQAVYQPKKGAAPSGSGAKVKPPQMNTETQRLTG